MADSFDALARRIRLGEDSELELKRVLLAGARVTAPTRSDLADELAAFANGRGGTLVLGVADTTREIVGIPLQHLDAVEGWVREICNDSVQPSLDAAIRKHELPDAVGTLVPVIRVDVPRSIFVHRSPGGYFRRIGSSKREMPPDVLARLFQERSQTRVIRFDESPVPGTDPDDLELSLANRFVRAGAQPTHDDLRKLRIVTDDLDSTPRLSVAGVLCCTAEPQRWLPYATIQAVSYAGVRRDVNYQQDARDIVGPLDLQVMEALHFVRRNALVRATKTLLRLERDPYSDRAIFEALVNAVAHRDYSMAGARVRLHMFSDRIELHVPGGLASTLTPDSMAVRQYSRNELIVSLLARCPVSVGEELGRTFLMDRRGDGVPIILDESIRLSGRTPEYTVTDDSELRLVIWAAAPETASS
ncbi:MAG: ATP-binding protein [Chloroflexota bacterium]